MLKCISPRHHDPFYVGHNHHSIARPLSGYEGYGLQIWMVAANTLNKQSRTPDKGCSSSFGIGRGANNSSP